ncbi:MAG: sugar kinase [Acidobacteria bacterium]|nr:sugar kinase [Acidobacteriota bacterium]
MSSIVVVGSVAYDAVETPFGSRERMLGGAATHFSLAAGFFVGVHLIGVVGRDFSEQDEALLRARGINLEGLERVAGGDTFFWKARYGYDLNDCRTLDTRLNVFSEFDPKLTAGARMAPFLFLANIRPDLQLAVLRQMDAPRLVALDTMNYWIEGSKSQLLETIAHVDMLIINDAEVRQLTGEPNLLRASRAIFEMGPQRLVIKRGEYGAAMFGPAGFFAVPGLPLDAVVDPTGAGDTFAGGFLGYLATTANGSDESSFRRAMIYGSVMASFNVEAFGCERLLTLQREDVRQRFREFKDLVHFELEEIDRLIPRYVEEFAR